MVRSAGGGDLQRALGGPFRLADRGVGRSAEMERFSTPPTAARIGGPNTKRKGSGSSRFTFPIGSTAGRSAGPARSSIRPTEDGSWEEQPNPERAWLWDVYFTDR
ncbi:MAG: hypothetical protein MPW15_09900 [Candidatus Manganitrophus sp.]|nr:hypothetical protein [Candidatus Manganitrophus sp.]